MKMQIASIFRMRFNAIVKSGIHGPYRCRINLEIPGYFRQAVRGSLFKVGYTGNGVHCKNINECMENSDDCPYDSECTDTEGSFTCACNPGYQDTAINGVQACVNIDECATTSTPLCATDASCIDTRSGLKVFVGFSKSVKVGLKHSLKILSIWKQE